MQADYSQSASEGEAASEVQQNMDWGESSPGTNDVTPFRNTDRKGRRHRSRQAYTLAFKLSVVEAYRNNGECKGNQRATARKFHIHRRQVQRWLRDERALSLRFKDRGAAAAGSARVSQEAHVSCGGAPDSENEHVSYEDLTSSDTGSGWAAEENICCLPRAVLGRKRNIVDEEPATNGAPPGNGPEKEDAVVDLTTRHRVGALEQPTATNTGGEKREQSVKRAVLAAYHNAHKWHGTAAGVAQKFGMMFCELNHWLKEEQESNVMLSSAVVLSSPSKLPNDTVMPSTADGTVGTGTNSDSSLAVQGRNAANPEPQQHTPESHSECSEIRASTSVDLFRVPNFNVDTILMGEPLKYLNQQCLQPHSADGNATMEPFYRVSIVPHVPSTYDSVIHLFPSVRPVSPLSEDDD